MMNWFYVGSCFPGVWHSQDLLRLPPGRRPCPPTSLGSHQSWASSPALLTMFSFLTRPPLPARSSRFHASRWRLCLLTPPHSSPSPSPEVALDALSSALSSRCVLCHLSPPAPVLSTVSGRTGKSVVLCTRHYCDLLTHMARILG